MSTGGALPVYFELSWAILSSFSLLNVVAGFLIVGITGFSSLWVVPVVCSTASAIANGLCYIAYYSDYSLNSRLPAAILADIFWCIQEAGLSFYSYQILRRFLRGRSRIIFLSLFWTLMASIFSFRLTILISRAQDLIGGGNSRQYLINHLHNGYFGSIAIVEILSSIFLLRIFAEGKRSSQVLATGNNLFKQLTSMQWIPLHSSHPLINCRIVSTELRVSSLALVGIGRAVAYSFQVEAQSATSVASQFDRFFFTLENYFPVVML